MVQGIQINSIQLRYILHLIDFAIRPASLQIKNALQLVMSKGKRKIGVLGFAFEGGTDDLRESPVVTLIEGLLGKGYDIKLYDSFVSLARLVGANRKYIEQHIPHISRLMVDTTSEIIAHSEVVIIGNNNDKLLDAVASLLQNCYVVDLTPVGRSINTCAHYERVNA